MCVRVCVSVYACVVCLCVHVCVWVCACVCDQVSHQVELVPLIKAVGLRPILGMAFLLQKHRADFCMSVQGMAIFCNSIEQHSHVGHLSVYFRN